MESASIAFCFEALRHCYNILGKERFRAETEYIMKLYQDIDKSKVSSTDSPLVEEDTGNSLKNLVIETHTKSQARNEVVVTKPVEEQEFIELPVVPVDSKNKKKSKAVMPEPSQSKIEKPEASTPAKWKRTMLPDEIRCQRIMPYNGGQCTFKKDDGSKFCSRHSNK
jgi:hypothetical protein